MFVLFRTQEFLYFFIGMFFLYILPLLVIVLTYGGIIVHLHSKKVVQVVKRNARFPEDGEDYIAESITVLSVE